MTRAQLLAALIRERFWAPPLPPAPQPVAAGAPSPGGDARPNESETAK